MDKNSIKKFNEKINLYKKISKKSKYIICWHKFVECICFFEIGNLEAIQNSQTIEIIFIPENEKL